MNPMGKDMNGYGYLKPPPLPMTIAKKKTPFSNPIHPLINDIVSFGWLQGMLNGTWLFVSPSLHLFSWLFYKAPVN